MNKAFRNGIFTQTATYVICSDTIIIEDIPHLQKKPFPRTLVKIL